MSVLPLDHYLVRSYHQKPSRYPRKCSPHKVFLIKIRIGVNKLSKPSFKNLSGSAGQIYFKNRSKTFNPSNIFKRISDMEVTTLKRKAFLTSFIFKNFSLSLSHSLSLSLSYSLTLLLALSLSLSHSLTLTLSVCLSLCLSIYLSIQCL
jgi:hypothetical protein